MPTNSTKTNHAEDVASMYGAALKERHGDKSTKQHISIPMRAETEMNGLLLVSTKREFCTYINEQLAAENCGIAKTYKCLVCIKHPSDIDRIEKLVGKELTHWVNVKSACPKTFTRTKPTSPKSSGDWQKCVMRITSIGDEKFRAACVSSKYSDSSDYTLAHRLWDPLMERPAEDVSNPSLQFCRFVMLFTHSSFSIISVGRIICNASQCSAVDNKTSSNPWSTGGAGLSNCGRHCVWWWIVCHENASS